MSRPTWRPGRSTSIGWEPGRTVAPHIEKTEGGDGPEAEPLRRQVQAFVRAVRERSRPLVGGEDGRRVLALAGEILARIHEKSQA
jgi:predicted dehydrogenase